VAGNNVVAGNLIGTDRTGTQPLVNWVGIGILFTSDGDVIGASPGGQYEADERNIISGNTMGIVLAAGGTGPTPPAAAVNTQIYGNYIGTDVTGMQALGNQYFGVGVGIGSHDVSIGSDTAPALANTIANNGAGLSAALHTAVGGPGVWILAFRATPYNISVQGNSIYGNAGLGIDLGGNFPSPGADGVTANDSHGHTGPNIVNNPNNWQNFPVLNSVTTSGSSTLITGTFDSGTLDGTPQAPPFEPNTTITLDFYANDAEDPTQHGQGQTYLGARTVTTDANGHADFSADFVVGTAGQWISATATDPKGNTSEFSADLPATSDPSLTFGQSVQASLPQSPTGRNAVTLVATSQAGADAFMTVFSSGNSKSPCAKVQRSDYAAPRTRCSFRLRLRR
jgi:hypothetical protein